MKQISFFHLLMILGLLITLPSCDKVLTNDVEDICNDTVEAHIERRFTVPCQIYYSDTVAYEGPIEFSIKKIYCSGETNGLFQETGATNINGYFTPGLLYTYKFDNSLDQVYANYQVNRTYDLGFGDGERFYYSDVISSSFDVHKTIQFTLPWASTD